MNLILYADFLQTNEQLLHCLIRVGTVPQTRRAPLLGRKPNWANDKAETQLTNQNYWPNPIINREQAHLRERERESVHTTLETLAPHLASHIYLTTLGNLQFERGRESRRGREKANQIEREEP